MRLASFACVLVLAGCAEDYQNFVVGSGTGASASAAATTSTGSGTGAGGNGATATASTGQGSGGGAGAGGGGPGGGGAGGAQQCDADHMDCSPSKPGCETDITKKGNCGGCGIDCAQIAPGGFECLAIGPKHVCGCAGAACGGGGTCGPEGLCVCTQDGTCNFGEVCIAAGQDCSCGGGMKDHCRNGFVCIGGVCDCDVLDKNGNMDGGASDCQNGGTCDPGTGLCHCGSTTCQHGQNCASSTTCSAN